MLSANDYRPGEPKRHLRHADELLDVARQNFWIEGILRDVRQVRAGLGANEVPASGGHLVGVIILAVARDACVILDCRAIHAGIGSSSRTNYVNCEPLPAAAR